MTQYYYLDRANLLYRQNEEGIWQYLSLSGEPLWIRDPDRGRDAIDGPYTFEHVCENGQIWWPAGIYELALQWLI